MRARVDSDRVWTEILCVPSGVERRPRWQMTGSGKWNMPTLEYAHISCCWY